MVVNVDFKRDAFLLFCSLLFYLAFLFLNIAQDSDARENQSFNDYDTPPEICNNIYEDRIFKDESGHEILRCVKLGIPEITIYPKTCQELKFISDYPLKEC